MLSQAKAEMDFSRKALDFAEFIQEWDHIEEDIRGILQHTSLDRFLVFRAWNGKYNPQWTSSILQMRLRGQVPINYVHFELDDDYRSRIKEIIIKNSMRFKVDDMPDCALKRVYLAEGVKSAALFHISTEEIKGLDATAVTYCSFASHEADHVSDKEMTRCNIAVGRLKGAALAFKDK